MDEAQISIWNAILVEKTHFGELTDCSSTQHRHTIMSSRDTQSHLVEKHTVTLAHHHT